MSPAHDRYRGFCDALTEAGLDPARRRGRAGLFQLSLRPDRGRAAAVARPSRRRRSSPATTTWPLPTVSVAHRRGLDVPDDLSIVGFDDTALATSVWPELTTVKQPIAAMAEAALELLIADLRSRRAGAAAQVRRARARAMR